MKRLLLALALVACSGGQEAPAPLPAPIVAKVEAVPAPRVELAPFVIIATGQSNGCGANEDLTGDFRTDPDVRVWVDGQFLISETDRKPYGQAHPATQNLVHWFALRVHDETGRPVRIIFTCRGGSLVEWWHDDKTPEGYNIRERHEDLINAAFNDPELAGVEKVDVMLWHQGERNWDLDLYPHEHYGDLLRKVFALYRLNDWMDNDTPIIVGELAEPGQLKNGGASGTSANQNAVLSHFAGEKNIWTAELKDLPAGSDKLHFTGASLQIAGYERYWQAWLTANGDQ